MPFQLYSKIGLLSFAGLLLFLAFGYTPSQFSNIKSAPCDCIPAQDSIALINLYKSTKGTSWKNTWDIKSPMKDWYGVHLNKKGCVKCLDLDGEPSCSTRSGNGNGLTGQIPDLKLPHLKYLLIASNELNGEIPDFSMMPTLRILRLSCNNLTGRIPNFKSLPDLKSLELDYNGLKGTVPDFNQLPNLESLYLLANKLSGELPSFSNLPKLGYFIASRNKFKGKIPTFYNNPELKVLLISENKLTGNIPDLIHLYNLRSLNLADNQLEGTLFDWGGLKDLEAIVLTNNKIAGPIPEVKYLERLKILNLGNNLFEGEIPDLSGLENLKTVILSENNLEICPKSNDLPALINYDVRGNLLELEDLKNNIETIGNNLKYSPQRYKGEDSLFVIESGTDMVLEVAESFQVEGNQYTWYLNGKAILEDSNEPTYWVLDLSEENIGKYYCKISHPNLPDLEFISPFKYIELLEEEHSAPEELSVSVDLTNWLNEIQSTQDITVPGAITPNGDGKNDVLFIPELEDNLLFPNPELIIFSASGQMVFHAKPYRNNWNGTFQNSNKALPDGIYFYALSSGNAKLQGLSGSITVFR